MKNNTKIENVGGSDYDFDFDFDFRLNPWQCCLIVPYAVFVFPFVLGGEIIKNAFHRSKKKNIITENYRQTGIQTKWQIGACCAWPR